MCRYLHLQMNYRRLKKPTVCTNCLGKDASVFNGIATEWGKMEKTLILSRQQGVFRNQRRVVRKQITAYHLRRTGPFKSSLTVLSVVVCRLFGECGLISCMYTQQRTINISGILITPTWRLLSPWRVVVLAMTYAKVVYVADVGVIPEVKCLLCSFGLKQNTYSIQQL